MVGPSMRDRGVRDSALSRHPSRQEPGAVAGWRADVFLSDETGFHQIWLTAERRAPGDRRRRPEPGGLAFSPKSRDLASPWIPAATTDQIC